MADKSSQIAKALSQGIKGFTSIIADRAKISGEIAVNALEAKNNFLYKMMEKQQLNPLEQQKLKNIELLKSKYETQRGTQPIGQDTDIFSMTPEEEIHPTGSGEFEVKTPSAKDFIFKKIQEKKRGNIPLSVKEQDFESHYLGMGEGYKKSPFELHQELKNALNAKMIQSGPESLTPAEKFIAGYKDPTSSVASYSDAYNKMKVEALNAVDKVGYDGLTESQKIILKQKPAKAFTPSAIDKIKGEMFEFKKAFSKRKNAKPSDLKNQLIDAKIIPALGPDWETNAPEVREYLEELYPEEDGGSPPVGFLPPNITKTSEAVNYLMKNKGWTKQAAIEWLRAQ